MEESQVSLWARLPEELVEAILAFLPLPYLIRASIVCKRWKSLLHSESFKMRCSQTPAHHGWLLTMGRNNSCRAYSSEDDAWYELPIRNLVGHSKLLSSASGLLCFEAPDEACLTLMVVDPIAKDVRKLPTLEYDGGLVLQRKDHLVGLYVVEHSCPVVYRVVVFVSGDAVPQGSAVVTMIFDSDVGSWRISAAEPPSSANLVVDQALVGSVLYCRVASTLGGLQVVAYDVRADSWTEAGANNVQSLEHCSLVASCQGELVLVNYGENGRERTYRERRGLQTGNVKLFQYDCRTGEWGELDQLQDVRGINDFFTEWCSAAGGSKGEIYLLTRRKHNGMWGGRIWRYDLSTGTWAKVQTCGRKATRFPQLLCYEPRWGLSMKT